MGQRLRHIEGCGSQNLTSHHNVKLSYYFCYWFCIAAYTQVMMFRDSLCIPPPPHLD